MADDDRVELTITLRDGVVADDVRAALERAGATVDAVLARLGLVSAVAPRALVSSLERVAGVEHVAVAPPPSTIRE